MSESYKTKTQLSIPKYNRLLGRMQEKEAKAYFKQVYQIGINNEIINKFKSSNDINLNLPYWKIKSIIYNGEVVNDTMFVYVKNYKKSIDYGKLIKYSKYKERMQQLKQVA